MAVALLVAGTALATIGALREGQQMATAEKYSARVAEAQAGAVRTSAAFESETLKKQSEIEQAQIRRAKQKATSTQRALYAKAGVRLEEGSPLEVMADTAAQYELDLAANRYNLATGLETIRYGSETQQAQLSAEAEYRRRLAKSYRTTSYLQAGSTLLTSAFGVAKAWPSGGSVIRGGVGGKTMQTSQFGKVWSPYK